MANPKFVGRKSVWIVAVLVLIFGGYVLLPAKYHFGYKAPAAVVAPVTQVTYQGVDGKNALQILEESHKVDTKLYGTDPYVTGIDGNTPDSSHFWSFYVNGQMAQVGASQYQTKSTDTVMWKVDAIQ